MSRSRSPFTIVGIVGARPNFVKIAPIAAALAADGRLHLQLVHTGQHYDAALSDSFFADLSIPRPDINLEVGSGSHAVQTAEVMTRLEPVLDRVQPAAVLVVGDVNSTIAAALVAAKKGIPVVHVEAGLRSFDRRMPEEVNRVLTDQISDLLFVTESEAITNLHREGISPEKIFLVGNVMIDALRGHLKRATSATTTLRQAGFSLPERFAVLTLHRPSNVDHLGTLTRLMNGIAGIASEIPVVFPVHPRTAERLSAAGLSGILAPPSFMLLPPLGYLEMLGLTSSAALVLTDSGGIQEETTALGVPCFTLRENTERPATVTEGTNTVIGTDPARLLAAYAEFKTTGGKRGRIPELWDGKAAQRITAILAKKFSEVE